jgi:hypothetical protein
MPTGAFVPIWRFPTAARAVAQAPGGPASVQAEASGTIGTVTCVQTFASTSCVEENAPAGEFAAVAIRR